MNLEQLSILDEFNLNSSQKEMLLKYASLLVEENNKYNLTALISDEEIVEKHFYDSLILDKFIKLNEGNVLDIGTGAGFPGIPLAIKYPNTNFYLLEASKKKSNFLDLVVKNLNLFNVKIINERCENLDKKYFNYFDFIVTRAVSELRIILELAIPFLKVNGYFLPYKGINYKEEVSKANNTLKILNSSLFDTKQYLLPLSKQERYILMIAKTKNIDPKYPRNYNLIKSKPL